MMVAVERESMDPVTRLIERANELLSGSTALGSEAAEWLEGLEGLSSRDLVRFDERARQPYSGIGWTLIPGYARSSSTSHIWARLRELMNKPSDGSLPERGMTSVFALVSPNGHHREYAVRVAELRPAVVRLIALRCIDWVAEVRAAALDRLADCPSLELLDALPLVEQLADERDRGEILRAFLGTRISDDDLRVAYRSPETAIRRAAWRQLRARDAATADEWIEVAARDDDVVIRAIAGSALGALAEEPRRRLAEVLVGDRIGAVAVSGLNVLANLEDGDTAILSALTGRSAGLRRAARAWASLRGIDARSVYLERLQADRVDGIALSALSELANPDDEGLFVQMLGETRSSIRADGLRGLAQVNPTAGRRAALTVISKAPSGRVGRAAASLLRDLALTEDELQTIAEMALSQTATPSQRLRAISLLRNARWHHLAALLDARDAADLELRHRLDTEIRAWIRLSSRVRQRPQATLRERIEERLPSLRPEDRQHIEFVLRTTA